MTRNLTPVSQHMSSRQNNFAQQFLFSVLAEVILHTLIHKALKEYTTKDMTFGTEERIQQNPYSVFTIQECIHSSLSQVLQAGRSSNSVFPCEWKQKRYSELWHMKCLRYSSSGSGHTETGKTEHKEQSDFQATNIAFSYLTRRRSHGQNWSTGMQERQQNTSRLQFLSTGWRCGGGDRCWWLGNVAAAGHWRWSLQLRDAFGLGWAWHSISSSMCPAWEYATV